jgi:predicted membrane protein
VNSSEHPFRITPRLIVGFGILAIGLLWTLDNLDILESEPITRWWPALLIVIGGVQLLDRRSNKGGPVILIVIGAVLVLRRLHWVHLDFSDLVPLFLAALGAKLIWDALARRSRKPSSLEDPDSEIHAFAMMGGVRRQSTAREFRGGDANAIMGGVELDLRNAHVNDGEEVIIDAFAMWGGVEIFVPPHWRVVGNVLPIMGAFVDKTTPTSGTAGPRLQVRGTVLMGGIEVKN